ncbi:hypothetical protein MNBD_BACTEROID05-701 [hydrothermal vent metagenome]|uniref:Uncharacterized protein n=1 Tax=hydrothermal vent metagenome TaxID=652676 RepID=A0A3B0TEL5_9ZZZZ
MNEIDAVFENEFIRHVRFEKPLTIIIEGKSSRAVIYKEGYVLPNLEEITVDDSPLSGFE